MGVTKKSWYSPHYRKFLSQNQPNLANRTCLMAKNQSDLNIKDSLGIAQQLEQKST